MDANPERVSQGVPHSTELAACTLCRRALTPENELIDDPDIFSLCGDCKFLFLENVEASTPDYQQRLTPRGRRIRYNSTESIENLFIQEFSHMINMARQNQSTNSNLENQSLDGDAAGARQFRRSSSRTTPNGSRRWRRVLSDAESDGFDNFDSLYAESESNVSFSRYRVFHGESDAISFSAYGGDSDMSVDGNSFLDTEMFAPPEDGSNFDSDIDIDPMHAGMNHHWDSEDHEEEEDDDDDDDDDNEEEEGSEWEEAEVEGNTVESAVVRPLLRNFFVSSPRESNGSVNSRWQFQSPEFEDVSHQRTREGRQRLTRNLFADLEEEELPPTFGGNAGDYLDARGFEELLEHLAETDTSRRGAPPASVSFVNGLPRVFVSEEHDKHGGLACAICKDVMPIGTEVNQLPCLHLYHRSCIFPWLSARNSCPLCRYELPTDDKDYEKGKRDSGSRVEIQRIQQHDESDEGSSDISVEAHEYNATNRLGLRELQYVNSDSSSSDRESGRGRWLFIAAAPIVSLVGIVLVLWLGNPLTATSSRRVNQNQANVSGSTTGSRGENRNRRWWSFF